MNQLKNFLSIKNLPVALSVILVFILGLQKNYSPDVGFHLRSAQWILENGNFMRQDVFTYASFGNDYFDMQWLYQLILYGLYKLGKDELLVIVNSALVAISFFLAWLRAKKEQINVRPELFLLVLIVATQALLFEIRPHVFSWLFLSLILLKLADYKAGRIKRLYILPVIMLIWANSHSLAILGLVVIGVYLIGSYFEEKKQDKHLVSILLLSLAAFIITPYFLDGFLFSFKQFGLIKGGSSQKLYIAELQTPFTLSVLKREGIEYLADPLFYIQLYSILVVMAGVKLFRKKQFTKVLLLCAFFVILYLAIKNYGYFIIVTLPFVVVYISEWLEERKKRKKWNEEKITKRLRIGSIALGVAVIWLCFTDGLKVLKQSPYRFGISIDEHAVPVEATAFLNKNKIYGKILNHLDFGGYLMFNYPEKIFIDGRLELPKPELFNNYFNSLKTEGGLGNLLAEYDPDIIIFPFPKVVGWWSYLINNPAYRAVYFDGLSAIYLKKGFLENIPVLTEKDVVVNSNLDIYSLINEDKPSRSAAVFKSFFQKQYIPIEEQNKATFCFTYGYGNAALEYSAIGIKKATVNPTDIFYNLSLYFNDIKKYNEAAICAKKAK